MNTWRLLIAVPRPSCIGGFQKRSADHPQRSKFCLLIQWHQCRHANFCDVSQVDTGNHVVKGSAQIYSILLDCMSEESLPLPRSLAHPRLPSSAPCPLGQSGDAKVLSMLMQTGKHGPIDFQAHLLFAVNASHATIAVTTPAASAVAATPAVSNITASAVFSGLSTKASITRTFAISTCTRRVLTSISAIRIIHPAIRYLGQGQLHDIPCRLHNYWHVPQRHANVRQLLEIRAVTLHIDKGSQSFQSLCWPSNDI
mmetsp:Transcript_49612/g.92991  ORF Transcript_49612/g.92991 Transcript_49612/m.92991 type:complete len:255 (-) Transcript_49612:1320-2084(-)